MMMIDTWIDHGMDTQQVVNAIGLKNKHNKVIGVAHSVGGTAMYVDDQMDHRGCSVLTCA